MLHSSDPIYFEITSKLFQIIRVSQKIGHVYLPLTTLSLYFAIVNENDSNAAIMAPIEKMSESAKLKSCEFMATLLKARCAGLVKISTDSNNLDLKISRRRVMYLHRTAKHFLEQPNTWAQILHSTSRTSFNPYVALLRSTIMQLKFDNLTTGRLTRSSDNVWTVVQGALMFARAAEIETDHAQAALLQQLTQLGSYHWKMKSNPLPPATGGWVAHIWKQIALEPNATLSSEFCQCQENCCDHNFISLSIQYGMPLYALDEIKHQPNSISRKTGRSWLDYAVSGPLHMASSHVAPLPILPNLALIPFLLESGSSPEMQFESITPWQRASMSVSDSGNVDTSDGRRRWTKVLELLLENGANPHAKVASRDSRSEESALAIITRVLVGGSSGDDEVVHSEAMKLQTMLMKKETAVREKRKFKQLAFWQRRLKS
jgi:hypothetical protein